MAQLERQMARLIEIDIVTVARGLLGITLMA